MLGCSLKTPARGTEIGLQATAAPATYWAVKVSARRWPRVGGEYVLSLGGVRRGVQCPCGEETFPHLISDLLCCFSLVPWLCHTKVPGLPLCCCCPPTKHWRHQPAATRAAAPRGCDSALASSVGGNVRPRDFGFKMQMTCKHFLERKAAN